MWERSSKTEPVNEPRTPSAPVTTATARPVAAPETRSGCTIGKAVKIVGDVISGEDLYIDGEVRGRLEARDASVTIGPNGNAKSDVCARDVVIHGQVEGNVEAFRKITIRKEGSLVGNIKTAGIVIDDDAYFKGSIDIVRNAKDAAA